MTYSAVSWPHSGTCSECGGEYLTQRKPREDRRRFCSDVCRDEAMRRKKREWIARYRAAQKGA